MWQNNLQPSKIIWTYRRTRHDKYWKSLQSCLLFKCYHLRIRHRAVRRLKIRRGSLVMRWVPHNLLLLPGWGGKGITTDLPKSGVATAFPAPTGLRHQHLILFEISLPLWLIWFGLCSSFSTITGHILGWFLLFISVQYCFRSKILLDLFLFQRQQTIFFCFFQ